MCIFYPTDSLENSPESNKIVKWSCWSLVVSVAVVPSMRAMYFDCTAVAQPAAHEYTAQHSHVNMYVHKCRNVPVCGNQLLAIREVVVSM